MLSGASWNISEAFYSILFAQFIEILLLHHFILYISFFFPRKNKRECVPFFQTIFVYQNKYLMQECVVIGPRLLRLRRCALKQNPCFKKIRQTDMTVNTVIVNNKTAHTSRNLNFSSTRYRSRHHFWRWAHIRISLFIQNNVSNFIQMVGTT